MSAEWGDCPDDYEYVVTRGGEVTAGGCLSCLLLVALLLAVVALAAAPAVGLLLW